MDLLAIMSVVAGVATTISVAGVVARWFYQWAFNRGVRQASYAERQLKFVYGPLFALLMDTHITSATSVSYPYIGIRVRRAKRFLKSYEYSKAATALFDKGVHESGSEVEYGRPIPLDAVAKIIDQNASVADTKLLTLYRAVRREVHESLSIGESYPSYPLSKTYLCFLDRIYNEHEHLSDMLNP